MKQLFAINDSGMDLVCAALDKKTDDWIDAVMEFEKLRESNQETVLVLNNKEVRLTADHFDEIKIAY